METRQKVGAALLAIAVLTIAVLVTNPGLLIGDPGPYNETNVTVTDENESYLGNLTVRIADTQAKRYTGLSETDSLASDEGMLFVHDKEGTQSYVMRNMSFPIDIIFIDSNGTVVRIVHANVDGENAPYSARARYVLEVNRGWANRTGLEAGDTVELPAEVS